MKMKYTGWLQGDSLLTALPVAGAVGGTGAAMTSAAATVRIPSAVGRPAPAAG